MTSLALVPMLLSLVLQDYVPPSALSVDRTFVPPMQVIGTTSTNLSYSWYPEEGSVRFGFRSRPSTAVPWNPSPIEYETVSCYMTSVAPIFAWGGQPGALIVVGVSGTAALPVTVVEKWNLLIATTPDGNSSFRVKRQHLFDSTALTHIRSAAAVQDGSALIGLHWESSDLVKIDLATGTKSVLLTKSQHPTLEKYGAIRWMRHVSQGDVFLLSTSRGHGPSWSENLSMLLWDPNSDGVPDTIEEFPAEEWATRGYAESSLWEPDYTFTQNLHAGLD